MHENTKVQNSGLTGSAVWPKDAQLATDTKLINYVDRAIIADMEDKTNKKVQNAGLCSRVAPVDPKSYQPTEEELNEKWDNRELGADEEHVAVAKLSESEKDAIKKAALGHVVEMPEAVSVADQHLVARYQALVSTHPMRKRLIDSDLAEGLDLLVALERHDPENSSEARASYQ